MTSQANQFTGTLGTSILNTMRAQGVKDGTYFMSGDVVDVSCDHAVVRSYKHLSVGSEFSLMIEKIGAYPCSVSRDLGGNCYEVRFTIAPSSRHRLAETIERLAA